LEETDMLFMVNIEVSVPPDLPQTQKDDLRRRETDRALELMKANKLRRIWRIVGQVANFSVWEADSLEELHANLGSLPLYPYMKVTVTPVIQHPATEAWLKAHGALPPF
jgi:muconolactone D-isomerase